MSCLFSEENLDKKQILVVDDVIDNSLLLATILESEGYEVDIASGGYTAIAKIEAHPPQLVLLDLMMPELDGYKVAKWIRQNQPSVAIVIVTAYDELPSFEQQQLHVDGFIHKPINIDELLTQVQAILEKNEGKITIETKIANTARCNAREVQCLGLKTRHRANFTSKF